jgi:hypothetical protein
MSTVKVGDLPLLLIDSRGQSALAVYGDSTHHVICNIDPNMGTSLSPDSGAWPTPVAPALISSNSALAMGTVVAGDANGSKGTMQIVGTIDPSVRSMTVDVPSVGTVTATVKDGYYSLFIPNSMIPSTQSSWTATLTLNDGTVRTEALNQMVSVAGGAVSIAGSNP